MQLANEGRGARDWSARQYVMFEDERTRPVRDLLSAIPTANPAQVADLGCGPGNSTELLHARYPAAAIMGLDTSPDMVAAARQRLPGVRFELSDVAHWTPPGPMDVLLSNAVLQWVPDHPTLLPRLAGLLAPGGTLAIQMPDNMDQPSHELMSRVAGSGPWADRLRPASTARTALTSPGAYYEMLRPHCTRVDIWRTKYHHVLPSPGAVVEWFKGSGLRPFLAPLSDTEREDYLRHYASAIAEAYPALPDGTVLLPFPRLFIVATR